MRQFLYLSVILFSFAGIAMLDWRRQLAFFAHARRTALAVAIGVAFFIAWDIAGISLDIFYAGRSPYVTGVMLGPEFPLEELFFLTFLCYFSLVVYRFWEEILCKRT